MNATTSNHGMKNKDMKHCCVPREEPNMELIVALVAVIVLIAMSVIDYRKLEQTKQQYRLQIDQRDRHIYELENFIDQYHQPTERRTS